MPGVLRFTLIVLAAGLAASASGAGYDQPGPLRPADVLPPQLVQSVHHTVEEAEADGRFYRFRLDTEFGVLTVPSLALLRIRVNELERLSQAVNQFAAQDQELGEELHGQLSVRADSALDILARPVATASDLAGQVADNLNETFAGPRPESSNFPGTEYGRTLDPGLAIHRRNVAAQWGLDSYSSNPHVQRFLDMVARTRAGGRIGAGAPAFISSSQERLSVEDEAIDGVVAARLKALDPRALAEENAAVLAAMQVRPDIVESFLSHPVYSPRHQTRIARYLEALDGVVNRTAFFEAALEANGEQVALAFEQAAMMLLHYHRNVARLQKLHAGADLMQAIAADNRVVHIAPVDLVVWTHAAEAMFDALAQRSKSAGFQAWELVAAGEVSATATRELEQRGYRVRAGYIH